MNKDLPGGASLKFPADMFVHIVPKRTGQIVHMNLENSDQLVEAQRDRLTIRILKERVAGAASLAGAFWVKTPKLDWPVPIEEACPLCEHHSKLREKTQWRAIEIKVKQHVKKRWMTEAYHKRIQKKWDKRFKINPKACAAPVQEMQTVVLSASVAEQLTAIAKAHNVVVVTPSRGR